MSVKFAIIISLTQVLSPNFSDFLNNLQHVKFPKLIAFPSTFSSTYITKVKKIAFLNAKKMFMQVSLKYQLQMRVVTESALEKAHAYTWRR